MNMRFGCYCALLALPFSGFAQDLAESTRALWRAATTFESGVARALALEGERGFTGLVRLSLHDAVTSDGRNFSDLEVEILLRGGQVGEGRVYARRYNKARHTLAVQHLRMEGVLPQGTLHITLQPDGWVPHTHRPAQLTVDLHATPDAANGRYMLGLGHGAAEANLVRREGDFAVELQPIQLPGDPLASWTVPDAPAEMEPFAERVYRRVRAVDMINHWPLPLPEVEALTRVRGVNRASPDLEAARLRVEWMRQVVLRAQVGAEPVPAFRRNHAATSDARFGPFYPPNPMSVTHEAAQLPLVDTEGPLRWHYIPYWDVLTPLPLLTDFDSRSLWLPEAIPAPGVDVVLSHGGVATWTRVFTGRNQENRLTRPERLDGRLTAAPRTAILATARVHSAAKQTVWVAVGFDHGKGDAGKGLLHFNGALVWQGFDGDPVDAQGYALLALELQEGENHFSFAAQPMAWNEVHPYLLFCTSGAPRIPTKDLGSALSERTREAREHVHGFRRDGTGTFPQAAPPLAWDLERGINVRWTRADLGHTSSSPIVHGAHLFTAADPYTVYALDTHSGKTLWSAELSPFEPKGPDVMAEAKRLYLLATDASVDQGNAPHRKNFLDHAHLHGVPIDLPNWGLHWQPVGPTHPTPVSDGTHVWFRNAHGGVACYTMEGTRVWYQPVFNQAAGGIMSPLLVDGLLILDGVHSGMDRQALKRFFETEGEGKWMMALNATTGEVVWKTFVKDNWLNGNSGFGDAVPVVVSDGRSTETLIVTCWSIAVRARDGKVVVPAQGLSTGGTRVAQGNVAVHDDTAYWLSFDRHGGAIRFHMHDPDTFGAERIWYRATGHNSHGATVTDGIVYDLYAYSGPNPNKAIIPWSELFAFDMYTGEPRGVLQPAHRATGWPHTAPVSIGRFLYLPTEGSSKGDPRGAITVVRAGTDPYTWARNAVYEKGFPDHHSRTVLTNPVTGLSYAHGGNSLPWADGDRLYLRLRHTLYCFGHTPGGQKYEAEMVGDALLDEIGIPPREATNILAIAPDPNPDPDLKEQAPEGFAMPSTWWVGPADASALPLRMPAQSVQRSAPFPQLDLIKGGAQRGTTVICHTVYKTDRPMGLEFHGEGTVRAWLSGQEISHGQLLRVEPGFYPLRLEVRVPARLPFNSFLLRPAFREKALDEKASWDREVARREEGLQYVVRHSPGSREGKRAALYLRTAGLPVNPAEP